MIPRKIRGICVVLVLLIAVIGTEATTAMSDNSSKQSTPKNCTIVAFRPFSSAVWRLTIWERGKPPQRVIRAQRKRLHCAPPAHRAAMQRTWRRDKTAYWHYRKRMLRQNINHQWAPHWAPDYGGPALQFEVTAALMEAAGMPGVTMAQISQGESGMRPGSAGVDPGGTAGYGLLAVTRPFANAIVAKYGGYEAMWNPVRNVAAASEIYQSQGIGAWYGTGYVTSWDAHYHGNFDLKSVLGGLTFEQALRRG